MKYCEYCGAPLPDDSRFCTACGNDVDTQVQSKSKSKTIIIIISLVFAALLIVGAVVAVGTVFFNSKDDTKVEEHRLSNEDKEDEESDTVSDARDTENQDKADEKDSEEKSDTAVEMVEETQEESIVLYPSVNMNEVKSVTATSALSEYNMTHYAERVIDGDISTGWVEGVGGQGYNESVTINFNDDYEISGILINAGFQESADLYYKNSRPSEIRITFSDGSSDVYSLQDKNGTQEIYLDEPVVADSVTFTILSVYAGNKYDDTVISEISLY